MTARDVIEEYIKELQTKADTFNGNKYNIEKYNIPTAKKIIVLLENYKTHSLDSILDVELYYCNKK